VTLFPAIKMVGPDGRPVAGAKVVLHPDENHWPRVRVTGLLAEGLADLSGAVVIDDVLRSGRFHAGEGELEVSGTFRWTPPHGQLVVITTDGQRVESDTDGIATVRMIDAAETKETPTRAESGALGRGEPASTPAPTPSTRIRFARR
jgi:hypothetical protein